MSPPQLGINWPFQQPVRVCVGVFQTVLKEGNLMKQTNSFQRWKCRYFKLRGRTLYYAQTSKVSVARAASQLCGCATVPERVAIVCPQSIIFDEVDLTDASVAESSTKNVNNSFTVSFCSSSSFSRLETASPRSLCPVSRAAVLFSRQSLFWR